MAGVIVAGVIAAAYDRNGTWSTALGVRVLYVDDESIAAPTRVFRDNATIQGPFMSVGYHVQAGHLQAGALPPGGLTP